MQFPQQEQFWLLIISFIILLYSFLNLTAWSIIISSGFIILALVLFVIALLNWRSYQIQMKIGRMIRLIQKEYGFKIKEDSYAISRLNSIQKKLWQYIVSDYPIDELLQIFSFSLSRLEKEVRLLAGLLEKNSTYQVKN